MRKTTESTNKSGTSRRKAPVRSPEARESQLVSLAMDRAEEMLENGTAPTGVIVHFLRAGAEKSRLERMKLEADTKLSIAKTEIMEAQQRSEELAEEALTAFKSYAGITEYEEDDEYESYKNIF